LLLEVPAARDAFWLRLGRETAAAFVDLWLYVAWRAPVDLSLGAVCAAGLAGWQSGTGALVTVALERADRIGGWHPLWDRLTRIHRTGPATVGARPDPGGHGGRMCVALPELQSDQVAEQRERRMCSAPLGLRRIDFPTDCTGTWGAGCCTRRNSEPGRGDPQRT